MPERLNPYVLSWAQHDLGGDTIAQATRAGKMPFVEGHVALMPDAHLGMGATVGSVIPTDGAIMPAAVGVDIGCGMIAVETSLTASDLPDDLADLLRLIEAGVPAGVGQGHRDVLGQSSESAGERFLRRHPNESVKTFDLGRKAIEQFGSLGSGNHFIEVCQDAHMVDDPTVWVVLHSGSRGVGNVLARRHIKKAKGEMKRRFISLEDPDLAYFVEGTPEFDEYIRDLMWAQDYALENRERMMMVVLRALTLVTRPFAEVRRINCHHNYTAVEHHHGRNMFITRKGAIRAREGDYGVIPGSMGTNSFIVRGLGNPASYHSSAHGAGRRMSRRQAKRELDVESLTDYMGDRAWLSDRASALVDEHPDAYKDIQQVMRDQADLVAVEVELTQLLNFKGT